MGVATELAMGGKASPDGPDAICFYAKTTDGVVGRVRELTKLKTPSDKPTLLLLDIPDQGGFYVTEKDELDAAAIREFLALEIGRAQERGRAQAARLSLDTGRGGRPRARLLATTRSAR